MPMRADAQRNLEQLLEAARELVSERGPNVPLEDVARRAGVGIATLYRRFPDREALLRAVAIDALERTRDAVEEVAEWEDAFEALATYLRRALELRVSVVLPQVLEVVDLDHPDVAAARDATAKAVEQLVDAAHASGDLPADVTFLDVGMMLVRIARPLPGPMPTELKDELARRHLDLFIRGLRAGGGALSGPVVTREDMAAMAAESSEDEPADDSART
ncbi:MAG TPA: helix-turn-helix domain-containing protein [Marmoricola sp.]|nr:helix-turn-helix domain-containing protein [Marmoricola sp.]